MYGLDVAGYMLLHLALANLITKSKHKLVVSSSGIGRTFVLYSVELYSEAIGRFASDKENQNCYRYLLMSNDFPIH